ncbi:alpha/beta hydrolase [Pseudomonas viridiflava]|uniref:alpha/beta hydrolase n=1 Tax=Pseudomonas viridiflava TaxID=33069 RepID=UPI0018E636E7|nr:alpha/beta hydrolase [Pseudomonas viridiflava]MBI6576527.1 lysophospholipase [Pseudomonas viridiflava]MBI6610470.1 lysophospholipase [Pseudomonas viridiflava]MBI6637954.1 lysophospholipase [Pseudomonas viridiflava]MBI6866278.1 lysophospholipase [Pseudomonas viridiflava]MEE4082551.1 alpha/beta hydrolase [Pseudomonas viridiflava]
MKHETFWLDASDHCRLYVNAWLPDTTPLAVVMLAHGMAEHSGRYGRLGAALNAAGIALYAHDQRGHGKTALQGRLGHFANEDGWSKVVDDLATLSQSIGQRHAGAALFLLGHSMGSYIAQTYLMHHGASLQGAILSGSNFHPASFYRSANLVVRFERLRQGRKGRSALIEWLSFGSFNKAFEPTRTRFDWLSRDPDEVDKYIQDPLCGVRCTNQLWADMLGGLQKISEPSNLAQIDSNLPLLIIGGECDPVSAGKRLKDLADALAEAGHQVLQLNVYPQARHELLNDINRDEVTQDLLDWLKYALDQPGPRRAE